MSDGENASIRRHSGDHVREGLNRHYFEPREAHGFVEGQEVHLVTELERNKTPKLHVHAGGELEEHVEEIGKEYIGGSYFSASFDHVHHLERHFDELVDEHDLEVLDDV